MKQTEQVIDRSTVGRTAPPAPTRWSAGRVLLGREWAVYVALVVLNVLDLITTAAVLDRGGSERNPLVKPIIDGIWDVALLKGLVLVLIAVLLMRCPESRIARLALASTTGWYLAVVAWNSGILLLL